MQTEISLGWDIKFKQPFFKVTDIDTGETLLSYIQMHQLKNLNEQITKMINDHEHDNPLSDMK